MNPHMTHLHNSLAAWGSERFPETFKREVEDLEASLLPLQQGLSSSSYVSESGFHIIILSIDDTPEKILVKTGVFYSGVIAGCNCADDPSPVEEENEYCVVRIGIDKTSASAEFSLLSE
jgi:hypothetical protein